MQIELNADSRVSTTLNTTSAIAFGVLLGICGSFGLVVIMAATPESGCINIAETTNALAHCEPLVGRKCGEMMDEARSGFEQTISQLEAEKAQLHNALQSVQQQPVANVSGFEQTISQLEAEKAQLQSVQQQPMGSCTLCEDDWLFVVGTGRSGSTTVLAMLDLIPSVLSSLRVRTMVLLQACIN